jgi:WXG100 family type VII secretion target
MAASKTSLDKGLHDVNVQKLEAATQDMSQTITRIMQSMDAVGAGWQGEAKQVAMGVAQDLTDHGKQVIAKLNNLSEWLGSAGTKLTHAEEAAKQTIRLTQLP